MLRKILEELLRKLFELKDEQELDDTDIIAIDYALSAIQKEIEGLVIDNPYPEDIFIEPTKEQYALLHKKLKEVGLTLDKFSGAIGRMVYKGLSADFQSNLSKKFKGE